MKQAIAGVAPPEVEEVTAMVVWPSIASYPSGRFLGRLYNIKAGFYVFKLGNLIALASIPHALALYAYRLLPCFLGLPVHGSFYRLTNRRVMELRNEVNLGEGKRIDRIGIGITGIVKAILLLVIFQALFIGWEMFPTDTLGMVLTGICVVIFVMGVAPLIMEAMGSPVPVPMFSYGVVMKSVELDRFDSIDVEQQPGQEWFEAGDLVFRSNGVETFRLAGVSRPEAFRHTCLKSQASYVGVKQARERETVPA